MATTLALQKAAQAWCTEPTACKEMDTVLAHAFAEIIDEYREALAWCSGSNDFQVGGQARRGWLKLVRPLLNN